MEDITAEVLRCRRIEVVDGEGVVRATLGTVDRGDFAAVLLGLCAPDGREHLTLYCDSFTAGVEMWETGTNVASLGSQRDGAAQVSFREPVTGDPVAAVKNSDPVPIGWQKPIPLVFRFERFPWLKISGMLAAEKE